MLVLRTNLPAFVSRSLSGNNCPLESRASFIDLNLIILNILASLPGRSCRKNAPAPLFAKCSQIVTTSKICDKKINAINEKQKSISLLKYLRYILCKNLLGTDEHKTAHSEKQLVVERFLPFVLLHLDSQQSVS